MYIHTWHVEDQSAASVAKLAIEIDLLLSVRSTKHLYIMYRYAYPYGVFVHKPPYLIHTYRHFTIFPLSA